MTHSDRRAQYLNGETQRPRQKHRARIEGRATRALVYPRVSTLGQEKNGKNLDGQIDEIRDYCKRKKYSFDEEHDIYRDIVSGARTDRVGYYRLLARLEREDAGVIVAWNVSRLGRNSLDGAWLMVKAKEHGFRIETAQEGMDFTQDPSTELVFDILTAAAKFQRNTILQDMMRGKRKGHRDGRFVTGNAPIGYTITGPRGGKSLTPNQDAEIVQRIYQEYVGGGTALGIARGLLRDGVTPKHGAHKGKWSCISVGNLIDSPVYVGMMAFRGEVTQGLHEPLVSREIWERAHALRLEKRAIRPGPLGKPR